MKRWLPAAILVMGLVYIFGSSALIFKLIPMWLILIYAYLQKPSVKDRYSLITIVGLFFCMLGDGLLQWFMIGLSAFLMGHLFYTAAFITRWRFSWLRFLMIIPVLIFGGFMGYQLYHALIDTGDGGLVIPVFIYLIAISLMGWFSIMTGNKWAMLGSILFITSDSILSWNMFVSDVAYSGPIIMLTYYTAQFLISRSIGHDEVSSSHQKKVAA
ncbi:lysoplasmalogenase [Paenibacillus segetis]|uniref:Lysoplasmalogenase n=1 Tax=Paenibacillus segetis TaxID=1325360 RepID=A0ABQ1Y656_9BACL|nr:lysoplasmalogenase [Paenibacillus segetis]GGH12877.1 hypothetical protein GCM10008013_05550 [Paenibacillus segetis]